jgi:curved DNA-binding protein CbpA
VNAFETLGLKPILQLSDEKIREAFRSMAGISHPDSGGDETSFAAIREAQETLSSPAKRLREWLIIRGAEINERGSISTELMNMFQIIAENGSSAETAIKTAAAAQSALTKGMAELALMKQREATKLLLADVEQEIFMRVNQFTLIEQGQLDAAAVMRDLIFLEKWKSGIRSLYGRLM